MTKTTVKVLAGAILAALSWPQDIVAETLATPFDTAVNTPRGQLTNPYADDSAAAEAGRKIYLSHDCNGCHGGGSYRRILVTA